MRYNTTCALLCDGSNYDPTPNSTFTYDCSDQNGTLTQSPDIFCKKSMALPLGLVALAFFLPPTSLACAW